MKRRTFVQLTSKALIASPMLTTNEPYLPLKDINVNRLSSFGKHHFFGYYGINPWDSSGQYHLALETDFDDRRPTLQDKAKVGYVDKLTHKFVELAQTPAFNLQQGSMMHWISHNDDDEFTYNDIENNRLIAYAVNFSTKKKRKIEGAIAAVSPNHREAIALDFQRMSFCRPTVGYAHNLKDYELINIPKDDGLYRLDLQTGSSELFLSIAEVINRSGGDIPQNQPAWFNHVLYSESGNRMLFFCRIKKEKKGFLSSLWTINRDGTHLECQIPFGNWVSHFDWKDDETILVTSNVLGKREYLEFKTGSNNFRPIGRNILTVDGHCSYLPNKNWIISDTYALGNARELELFLFNIEKNRKISLGTFPHPQQYKGVIRCDLHPRVSVDGTMVSFDSVYEGSRQIYTVAISEILLSN